MQLTFSLYHLNFQVNIGRNGEFNARIEPQDIFMSGDGRKCVAYYQFISKGGSFNVLRKGVNVEDYPELKDNPIVASDKYMESNFEYYECM